MRQCCGCGCGRGRMCLPLCVIPRAAPGRVRAYCCGAPKLVRANDPGACCGECRYILRQPMMAEIPVEIGAAAFAGTPFLQFDPQCNCWKWEEEEVSCNCARTACNASIDYTQVPGERILPF